MPPSNKKKTFQTTLFSTVTCFGDIRGYELFVFEFYTQERGPVFEYIQITALSL